jgi:hypothetical protein
LAESVGLNKVFKGKTRFLIIRAHYDKETGFLAESAGLNEVFWKKPGF